MQGFVSEEAWQRGKEELRDEQSKTKDECINASRIFYDALPERDRALIDLEPMRKYSSAHLYSRVDMHMAAEAPRGSAWRANEEMYKVLAKLEFHVHRKPLRVNV